MWTVDSHLSPSQRTASISQSTNVLPDVDFYGYRFYYADNGRWINRDPIEEQGGLNVYGFVSNNSINFQDFLGLEIICDDCEMLTKLKEMGISVTLFTLVTGGSVIITDSIETSGNAEISIIERMINVDRSYSLKGTQVDEELASLNLHVETRIKIFNNSIIFGRSGNTFPTKKVPKHRNDGIDEFDNDDLYGVCTACPGAVRRIYDKSGAYSRIYKLSEFEFENKQTIIGDRGFLETNPPPNSGKKFEDDIRQGQNFIVLGDTFYFAWRVTSNGLVKGDLGKV